MPIRIAGRTVPAVLATCALVAGLAQVVAQPAAGAAAIGKVALGDSFAAGPGGVEAMAAGLRLLPGPESGDATRVIVDAANSIVRVWYGTEASPYGLTLAWPLRVGTWTPNAYLPPEPEQRVSVQRGNKGCAVTGGALVVHEAEADADGGVAKLSVDLSGGRCPDGWPSAQVRIGTSTPISPVPVATPRQFHVEAQIGTTVTQRVSVRNAGPGTWTAREVAISSSDVYSRKTFTVTPGSDTCTGAALPVGGECEVTVNSPVSEGNWEQHLVVAGDGAADVVVPLRVVGLKPVPAPTDVVVVPGRTGAQVSWTGPFYNHRYSYTDVYDVTGGRRTHLATAGGAGKHTVRVPGAGLRALALVTTSPPIASPEVRIEVAAQPAELVAERPYGSAVAFPVPGGAGEREAAWSITYPNGPQSSVLTRGEGMSLDPTRTRWLVPTEGGGLWLCDIDKTDCAAIPSTASMGRLRGAMWLPDGRIAAISGADEDRTLWTVSVDGTTRRVRTLPADPTWSNFAALPSGTEIAAMTWDGIFRIRLSDGRVTAVPGTQDVDGFTVTTGGALVVYQRLDISEESGPTRTSVLGLDGKVVRVLPLPEGDNRRAVVDPAGKRLAFVRQLSLYSAEIWTANADGTNARRLSTRTGAWGPLHWSVDDAAAPKARVSLPAASGSAVTVGIGASDADDPAGSLLRQCRLDNGSWKSCGPTWNLTGLRAGTHTVSVRVSSPGGRSVEASKAWIVDLVAPTARTAAAPSTVGRNWTLRWSGTDRGGAGIATYDVRKRTRSAGVYSPWVTTVPKTTKTSVRPTLKAGRTYCFAVRARDAAGNTGKWSDRRCVTVRSS